MPQPQPDIDTLIADVHNTAELLAEAQRQPTGPTREVRMAEFRLVVVDMDFRAIGFALVELRGLRGDAAVSAFSDAVQQLEGARLGLEAAGRRLSSLVESMRTSPVLHPELAKENQDG